MDKGVQKSQWQGHSCCTLFLWGLTSQDSTFEFEKIRNRPVKYNRDLMAATLKAMKRVSEIQSIREKRFHEKRFACSFTLITRMALAKEQQRIHQKTIIARVVQLCVVEVQNVELLRPAAAKKTEDVIRAEQVREEMKARKAEILRQKQNKNKPSTM